MAKNINIKEFFTQIRAFLLNHDLESEKHLLGYSCDAVYQLELRRKIQLPYSYKLFLEYFAQGRPKFFDGQDYSISGIKDANIVANSITEADKTELPAGAFVFSQWQGYNFDFFVMGSDNPEVLLYTEGDGSPCSHDIRKCNTFTDWICERVVSSLTLYHRYYRSNIEGLLAEVETIKQLPADYN